jgi:hypothetical protein
MPRAGGQVGIGGPERMRSEATAFNPDGPALRAPSKAEYFDVQPTPTGSSQRGSRDDSGAYTLCIRSACAG